MTNAVDEWFDTYDNPQKAIVQQVRHIILDADPKIEESIKWQAPTFMYKGNIASFFPRSKKTVTLMFHTGASIDDPSGLLEGEGEISRVARFANAEDLRAKKENLQSVVRAWIIMKDKGE